MNLIGPLLITFSFFAGLFVVGIFLQRAERSRRKMQRVLAEKLAGIGEMSSLVDVARIISVDVNAPYEVRYWANALGVSEEELIEAARRYGDSIAAIRKGLASRKR
jgi:hypothetical protein